MTAPNPRTPISFTNKPGGWYSVEDFMNELSVFVLATSTIKALAVAVVDTSGTQITPGLVLSSTATLSQVAVNAASTTLLAANTSRKGAVIHNNATAILYVAFAATATSTAFTYRLNPTDTLEIKSPVYTGLITGIWASASGTGAVITELT